jgi:predicted nucleic acid-binding protein
MAGLAVVLDTNVLLSGLAYPASVPGRLIAAWRFGALEVVLSDFILAELRRTLPRLVDRHGLTPEAISRPSCSTPAAASNGSAPMCWRLRGGE